MVMDKRIGSKIPTMFRREDSPIRTDPGPYIGRIKNNLDPTRSGRVQVYIPDLNSGDEDNPDNWRTVAYASPFMGVTNQPDTNKQNSFKKVRHSYGMWFVPPDIGNLVLCTFIAGDPNRGFWFACIPSQLGHHMLPGIAGSYNVDGNTIEDSQLKANYNGKPTVVSEFNENGENVDWANFVNAKKPVHEDQYRVYQNQGLEEDYVRGIISSTSQRESPSFVFGISSPGRPHNDPADDPEYNEKIKSGILKESDYAVSSRKGGHVFVLDDGNFQGKDKLIRLRTSGGHQLLMNDSENILYIGNSTGSVWIELTGPGHMNIYTGHSLNIRAEQDINLHADRNIHLNAGSDILFSAGKNLQGQSQTLNFDCTDTTTIIGGGKLNLGSTGSINISAGTITNVVGSSGVNVTGSTVQLNDGISGTASFDRPSPLKFNKLSDTGKQGKKWVSVDGALSTIVPIAPTHEPWGQHKNTNLAGYSTAVTASSQSRETIIGTGGGDGESVIDGPPPEKEIPKIQCEGSTGPLDPGPKDAAGQGVTNPCSRSYMNRSDAPIVSEGLGPLTAEQFKALIQQTGWSESSCKYPTINQLNFIGKYQFGVPVLVELGYIKMDAYRLYGGNRAAKYPNSWTGKDGINSQEDFLNNGPIQEKVIIALFKLNYNRLLKNGGIKSGDDQCTIAGMLSVAHLLGATGAKNWRTTAAGADANGTSGSKYFNRGRYAVDVLAAPVQA